MLLAILLILLFEVHSHETPFRIQQEVEKTFQQYCQKDPSEKPRLWSDARRPADLGSCPATDR